MSAIETLTALVTEAMKPLAKAGGFKKQKLTYLRRRGATTQVVNFQLSRGNSASEACCYVNVAVAIDAVFELEGKPVPPAPKEYECPFRERLENFVAGAPEAWLVNPKTDAAALGEKLGACMAEAIAWLDAIDGPAAMLAKLSLDRGAQLFLRAQLRYLTGDRGGALADARGGVAFFADRGLKLDEKLHALGLSQLAAQA